MMIDNQDDSGIGHRPKLPSYTALTKERNDLRTQVDELAMLIRMLVHAVRKTNPDNKTAQKAMDYLQRYGLQGSILR